MGEEINTGERSYIQLASASGNNPPSTTLNLHNSRFTAITPPKKGKGRESGKTWIWGRGAEDDRERGNGGRTR
jgi:hypothetical protein